MKKTMTAILMAGAMVLGSFAAFAESTEVTEITYEMIDPEVFEGTWVSAFGVFDLYLPSDWNVLVNVESEEEVENNVYFQAVNDDQTQSAAISYAASEYTDINDVCAAYAAAEGFTDVDVVVVNGIEAVAYTCTTEDVWTAGLVALGDQGGLYNVTVGCEAAMEEEFTPWAFNILVSFSATEYVEETEA